MEVKFTHEAHFSETLSFHELMAMLDEAIGSMNEAETVEWMEKSKFREHLSAAASRAFG
jgi:hypothetical protein